ncbi:MAG TPA: nuclear transport factor 2 family protein [Puia sp.]|jgi:hypothetical protein
MTNYVLLDSLESTGLTAKVIKQFQEIFLTHDDSTLPQLVSSDCIMESARPAPDGIRYAGMKENIDIWSKLATDTNKQFEFEEVFVSGDRAIIRWRHRWGTDDSQSVRGVNLMRISGGVIVEALAYVKAM